MLKHSKKFIIFCLIAGLGTVISGLYLPQKSWEIFAQQEATGLFCDTKIPIGEAVEATRDVLDDIYLPLQEMYKEVEAMINTASTQLRTLGKDAKNCDLSVCRADCRDIGPGLILELRAFFFKIVDYPGCIALCEGQLGLNRSCLGKPCPDLEASLEMFDDELTRIENFKNMVINVLRGKNDYGTRQVTEDIIKEWERYTTFIPKIEFARRKLDRARRDFFEWAMSAEDWAKVARDELTPRLVARCPQMLEAGNYWPSPWLEGCPTACKELTTSQLFESETCRACICVGGAQALAKDACLVCLTSPNPLDCQTCLDPSDFFNYSPQAAISCKLFGACKHECEKGLAEECQACICAGLPNIEVCQNWICGGNLLNWVGCH